MVPSCCQVQSKLRSQFLGPLCLWQCFDKWFRVNDIEREGFAKFGHQRIKRSRSGVFLVYLSSVFPMCVFVDCISHVCICPVHFPCVFPKCIFPRCDLQQELDLNKKETACLQVGSTCLLITKTNTKAKTKTKTKARIFNFTWWPLHQIFDTFCPYLIVATLWSRRNACLAFDCCSYEIYLIVVTAIIYSYYIWLQLLNMEKKIFVWRLSASNDSKSHDLSQLDTRRSFANFLQDI